MAARYVWMAGAVSVLVGGCLLEDKRCGENQFEFNDLFEGCMCVSGAVPNANGVGCRKCDGLHEEAKGTSCACTAGYRRTSPTAACEMAAETPDGGAGMTGPLTGNKGEGDPCSASMPCTGDATFCMTYAPPPAMPQCLVQGCATRERLCAAGRECCVVTALPQLAETGGFCVPQGGCTAPGMVVTP